MRKEAFVAAVVFALGLAIIVSTAPAQGPPAPYYPQPYPQIATPARPPGVWVAYPRPNRIGQKLFGPFYVWYPVVRPTPPTPQAQP